MIVFNKFRVLLKGESILKTKYIITLVSSIFFISVFAFSQTSDKAEITVAELLELINSDTKQIILDVRNPDELVGKLGHIAGVINIPVHKLENRLSELNKYKGKKILIICRSGNRSRYATAILNKNGFIAFNVVGGMRAYRKIGK